MRTPRSENVTEFSGLRPRKKLRISALVAQESAAAGRSNDLTINPVAFSPAETFRGVHGIYKNAIILTPLILCLSWAGLLLSPATRPAALWMLSENHPVELLTFLVAVTAGVFGLRLSLRARKNGETRLVFGFYALFSAALFLLGLEEIAWGQQLFGFDTPAVWQTINVQKEITLHNLAGIQGRSEIFRLAFGLGGLIGAWMAFHPRFQKIGTPKVLISWFVIIALHAGVDVYNDFWPIERQFDFYLQRTSKLIELIVAMAGFMLIALNSKKISANENKSP